MSELQNYQKSLINNCLEDLKSVISGDYSIGKMNRILSGLKEDLTILPQYRKYAVSQIHEIINHYRHAEKAFYHKFRKMNPKYLEVILNLSNFKG